MGRDDFTNLLLVFDTCFASADPRRWCRDHFVHSRALQTASRTLRQLEELLDRSSSLRTGSGGASADALPSCEKAVEAYVEWKQHLPSHARDRFAERRPLPASVIESIRRALCFGFFNHVARGAGTSFRTMDGHASAVAVHPSSFMMEEPLTDHGWVMYNEVRGCPLVYPPLYPKRTRTGTQQSVDLWLSGCLDVTTVHAYYHTHPVRLG